jgi:hypothetical protein
MVRVAAGVLVLVCAVGSVMWMGAARSYAPLAGLFGHARASASPADPVQARQADLLRRNRGLASDEDLAKEYNAINAEFFGGRLPAVPVRWDDGLKAIGPLVAAHFRLEGLTDGKLILVNPEVAEDPEGVRRTLCHEMVHVATFDQGAGHGPVFQQMLRDLAQRGAFAGIVATDEEKDARRATLRTELEQLEAESRAIPDLRVHLEYDRAELQSAIESYNQRVADANARREGWPSAEEGQELERRRAENRERLAAFNARVARYNESIARYNRAVDEYNLMVSYPDGLDRERLSRHTGVTH